MAPSSHVPPVPAVLRLVQTVVLGRWRTSVEALYRELASLLDATPGHEILVSGCGEGRCAEWLAARVGAQVIGVDSDADRIEAAEARLKLRPKAVPVSFQVASLDDLPYEDNVFDGAVGEVVLAAARSPEQAVRELVRVVKPMSPVILCQLAWNAKFDADAQEMVVERLGLRPRHVVEWKQLLRDAGAVDIEVQDWTDSAGARAAAQKAPVPRLTWPDKMSIVSRAWRRQGLRVARGAVEREIALLRELSRERAIGFQVIKGIKWPHAKRA